MTTPDRTFTAALLRQAVFLAGLLAIVAGIFGMHVMTGTHSGHAPAAASSAPGGHAGTAATGNQALHLVSGTSRTHPVDSTARAHPAAGATAGSGIRDEAGTAGPLCSFPDSGTGLHAMTGSCIPSVKTGPLSAPSPGTAVSGIIAPTGSAGGVRADWCYLPGTPSPGELSISRT